MYNNISHHIISHATCTSVYIFYERFILAKASSCLSPHFTTVASCFLSIMLSAQQFQHSLECSIDRNLSCWEGFDIPSWLLVALFLEYVQLTLFAGKLSPIFYGMPQKINLWKPNFVLASSCLVWVTIGLSDPLKKVPQHHLVGFQVNCMSEDIIKIAL